MSDVQNFFSQQSDEDKAKVQGAINSAESSKVKKVEKIGNFLMRVVSRQYEKTKQGGNGAVTEVVTTPSINISSKGSLMLNLTLAVEDGVPGTEVSAGDYNYFNFPICAAPGSPIDKVQSIANLAKPNLFALTGEKDIEISLEWIQNLIPKFEKQADGTFKIVKEHNMNNLVMAKTKIDNYNGIESYKIDFVRAAKKDDKSFLVEVKPTEQSIDSDTPNFGSAVDNQDDAAISALGGGSEPAAGETVAYDIT